MPYRPCASLVCCLLLAIALQTPSDSAEIAVITSKTNVPENKESDWIFGDLLLQNANVVAVIAQPRPGRNANMTVRGVSACVIDLTTRAYPNDQLSAFFPTGGRFNFTDPKKASFGTIESGEDSITDSAKRSGSAVFFQCTSASAINGALVEATVRYELHDGDEFLRSHVKVRTLSDKPLELTAYDGVRADRSFRLANLPNDAGVSFCEDSFFGQTYGFVLPTKDGTLEWGKGRMRQLKYSSEALVESTPAQIQWSLNLVPTTCLTDLSVMVPHVRGTKTAIAAMQTIVLADDFGPVGRASITIDNTDDVKLPKDQIRSRDDGTINLRLPPGKFTLTTEALGYEPVVKSIVVNNHPAEHTITFGAPARIEAQVTDVSNKPSPAKFTFYGVDGTESPDFGPDSTSGAVKNCVYSVDGMVRRSIDPGTYEIVISRGPEFDAVFETVTVEKGKATNIQAVLKRSVITPGWVSAELHSHSTPSGDNTSLQRGRVENLLCEHLEFAPCTEHNRIDSYTPHLKSFGAEHLMATCTGMELTGSPLPVNHQNAFPMIHKPHTQDGGGPTTSGNPVVQIERLAMWDNGSPKVIQGNHPNIRQQYGDRDTNGKPDEGFRKMFGFMDVIEVHPPAAIFESFDKPEGIPKNRIAQWLQLLNQGIRVPGVVNTDAHYNHHGSGWLRNWFESSTDDPAKISVDEMIHACEHGHIVMSTGPYMSLKASTSQNGKTQSGTAGDQLITDDGNVSIQIEVQCPNWLDINRVQIFINGRSSNSLNFTRRDHPNLFANEVTKFKQTIPLILNEDSHIIVATLGQGLTLGKVMGERYGKLQPCAVSNPIWIDTDGKGFVANHDGFGHPLPGAVTGGHSHD